MANEKRLIDAAELGRKLEALAKRYYEQGRTEATKDYFFVQTVLLSAPTVDAVEVVHDRLFNLPNVSNRDYQDFVDGLEDYFKEAAFDDRSVGIFGMTEGETLLANALMEFLKFGAKRDGDG